MDWSKPFVPREWNLDVQISEVSKKAEALKRDLDERGRKLQRKPKLAMSNRGVVEQHKNIHNKYGENQKNSGNYLNSKLHAQRYSGLLNVTVEKYTGQPSKMSN